MKNPVWSRAEDCSKRTLTQIAANVKRGIALEQAIESWTEAISKRNDPAARREHQPRLRVTPYLMPDDVAMLNATAEEQGKRKQASDMSLLTEARKDTIRVEEIVPSSTPKGPSPRPNYSTGSKPRKTRKRRRPQGEEEDETRGEGDEQIEGGWARVGKHSMVKRVRNHLIRKAVNDKEGVGGESDGRNTPTEQPDNECLTQPSAQPSKATAANTQSRQRPTYDGPAVALVFRNFIELCIDIPSLDNDEASERKCCDACRPLVQQKFGQLRSELEKWAAELERVESHTSSGDVVHPSQEQDVSPLKQALLRQSPLTIHDSDSDGLDLRYSHAKDIS